MFEFCNLYGTRRKNGREAESYWLLLLHLGVVIVHWLRAASCQGCLISLAFVLCVFAEPEAAAWGRSWRARAREGH